MPFLIRAATLEDWDGYRAAFESVAAEGRWIGAELPIDWHARRRASRRPLPARTSCSCWPPTTAATSSAGRTPAMPRAARPASAWASPTATAPPASAPGYSRAFSTGPAERGAHKVVLEVWPHNTRAIGLYEKLGFVVEGRYRRHWRRQDGSLWDAVMMGLVLDETSPGGP